MFGACGGAAAGVVVVLVAWLFLPRGETPAPSQYAKIILPIEDKKNGKHQWRRGSPSN